MDARACRASRSANLPLCERRIACYDCGPIVDPWPGRSDARLAYHPYARSWSLVGVRGVRGVRADRAFGDRQPSQPGMFRSTRRRAWPRLTPMRTIGPIELHAVPWSITKDRAKADRIKALIARGGALCARIWSSAPSPTTTRVLRLDPGARRISLNARGELWRKKGDRPKALADFGAAIKLNPDHPAARGQLQIAGAGSGTVGALMAVAGKPSFNCATGPPRGGKGDLRQPRACRSRPRDQCGEHTRWCIRRAATIRVPAARCSASRMNLSPAATPRSAGRVTICARPCKERLRASAGGRAELTTAAPR